MTLEKIASVIKLLLDQNLSYRLIKRHSGDFGHVKDARSVNLYGKRDIEIWEFARKNGYAIVTNDADFLAISILKGVPPPVIRINAGPLRNEQTAQLLIRSKNLIESFCLEIEQGTSVNGVLELRMD